MGRIRAFIAVDIPQDILDKISEIQGSLRKLDADVSWTRVEGIHVTLSFLGDIEEGQVGRIGYVMEEAAARISSFDLAVSGSGVFPSMRNPRIAWLGIKDSSGLLKEIYGRLQEGLKQIGYEPEEREFRPHVTLGRMKGGHGREEVLAQLSALNAREIGTFTVEKMVLYRSELRPSGAVYTGLREVKFGKL